MSLDTNIQISRSRVAIITGPAGDLGRAIALRLASDGFLLALTDLPEREIDLVSLNAEIDKAQIASKADILYVTGDISVEADVQRIVDATVEKFGNLDVMVSNAAIFKSLSIDAMDSETWDKIFSVNVRGMMLCYKWAAKQMVKQGRGGKLIGGCSVAGLTGAPLCSAYCASKFAVRGLTQTAGEPLKALYKPSDDFVFSSAMEYASKGITANAYAPGFIGGTRMFGELRDQAEELMGIPQGGFEQYATTHTIKLGKLGRPEDIACLVSFLASKGSAYITGQTYSCDGGMHIA